MDILTRKTIVCVQRNPDGEKQKSFLINPYAQLTESGFSINDEFAINESSEEDGQEFCAHYHTRTRENHASVQTGMQFFFAVDIDDAQDILTAAVHENGKYFSASISLHTLRHDAYLQR